MAGSPSLITVGLFLAEVASAGKGFYNTDWGAWVPGNCPGAGRSSTGACLRQVVAEWLWKLSAGQGDPMGS